MPEIGRIRTHILVRSNVTRTCALVGKAAETGKTKGKLNVAQTRILICNSCSGTRDRDAERQAVARALAEAGLAERIELAEHACFNGCQDPVALALQGAGMASYVFSGVDVVADADDIAATCQTYLDSPTGWIEDARPCGRLRLCLRTRIPALQST